MKTNYLLPHKYKKLGWTLLSLGIISFIILGSTQYEGGFFEIKVLSIFNYDYTNKTFFKIIKDDIRNEVISILIIVGGLLVGFTKEKIEDEFIYKLRNDSLVWAFILNYTILLITILFIYGGDFFEVMMYNIFTPLIFFIIRFNFLKYKSRSHEE
ncbi:hypothetical protein QLS71_018635 [Mariniflexile litorale]|uniref:Uncharacterized protein n=1 Tax=Mariniflexile litorale TaxID=3045158 RepID=A0AAU7EFC1_9FLAO|nr:hypothetical protein [Mariniflexile sp. KMM 9835]MDQ8211780.1 hypothetical protein [Mariniflexile sp. KMM 9835]